MITMKGKYNTANIMIDVIDDATKEQIQGFLNHPAFGNTYIAIMPDCHAGAGAVVGFTMKMNDYIIPNVIGVDIGCGMLSANFGEVDINLQELDDFIKKNIPSGFAINQNYKHVIFEQVEEVRKTCNRIDIDSEKALKAIGSLGGGNHFIELAEGKTGDKYFIVHSGSRNLGKQCADYYQKLAIKKLSTPDLTPIIDCMKQIGLHSQISYVLHVLKGSRKKLNPDLAYLTGEDMQAYLHDMKICQAYAMTNRWRIFDNVQKGMGWNYTKSWTTMHNYIDEDNIVRKGAVSAKKGE